MTPGALAADADVDAKIEAGLRPLDLAIMRNRTASPAWPASAPTEIGNPLGPAPTLPRCTCSVSDPTPPSLG